MGDNPQFSIEDAPEFTYTPRDLLHLEHRATYPPDWGQKVSVIVERVNGACPISVEGDVWVVENCLHTEKVDIGSDRPGYCGPKEICSIAFHSVQPYIISMSIGVSAQELGIAVDGEDGFVMCPAWGPPTCEAAVVMRLHPEPVDSGTLTDDSYEYLARNGYVSVPTYFLERFGPEGAQARRKALLEEWYRLGRPKFWEGWDWDKQPRRDPPYKPVK
jgi:uncharacterized repeat protein (TIGR04076 family)